jgi:hypothetical protein
MIRSIVRMTLNSTRIDSDNENNPEKEPKNEQNKTKTTHSTIEESFHIEEVDKSTVLEWITENTPNIFRCLENFIYLRFLHGTLNRLQFISFDFFCSF